MGPRGKITEDAARSPRACFGPVGSLRAEVRLRSPGATDRYALRSSSMEVFATGERKEMAEKENDE